MYNIETDYFLPDIPLPNEGMFVNIDGLNGWPNSHVQILRVFLLQQFLHLNLAENR